MGQCSNNDDHHNFIYFTTQYYNSILEQNMTLCECLRWCTGICNESRVTCMKELWTVALPQIRCQLHDHAKQYDNDERVMINGTVESCMAIYLRMLWKCHNRLVWWLFWGGYKEVYVWKSVSYHGVWMHRRSLHQLSMWERAMHGTEEASNDGKVRVRIIHGLNISHKELTYLLQKSTSHQKPSITRMLLGG